MLTYGRTGSTVLQAALNEADGVCVRGENHGAVNHLRRAYDSAVRTRGEHGGADASGTDDPWFGAHLVELDGLLEHLRRTLIEGFLRPPSGTRVVGFKEIRHTTDHFETLEDLLGYALFLDRLLPGVRFVVNTRNVEDTSRSSWWRDDPRSGGVLEESRRWLLDLPALLEERLGPGRVVVMEYDEWKGRPESLLGMLEQLGLRADPARIERVAGRRLGHMENWRREELPPSHRGG